MRINKSWLGYTLYGLILTGVLLYYRFPSDAFREYLQTALNEADARVSISITGVHPSFPLDLKLNQTEISLRDKPGTLLFRADGIQLRPQLWSLIHRELKYAYSCHAYGGELKGLINLKGFSVRGPIESITEINNVRIGDYPYLRNLIGPHIEGNLGGKITYNGEAESFMDGTSEAELKITDGRLEYLKFDPLNFQSIEIKQMEIMMNLKNGIINLTRFEFKGDKFQGSLTGKITLRKEFVQSTMELKGSIQPSATYLKGIARTKAAFEFIKKFIRKGRISFSIYGTLKKPSIRFL